MTRGYGTYAPHASHASHSAQQAPTGNVFVAILVAIAVWLLFLFIFALIVMALWNGVMPQIFPGVRPLSPGVALGFVLLVAILGGIWVWKPIDMAYMAFPK